jgi:hypothetical protein
MNIRILAAAALFAAAPFTAEAQVVTDTVNGAQRGADQGDAVGGPIGGIVGGAIGAGVGAATGAVGTATGIVGGVLGVEERPRFHEFVEREHRPGFRIGGPVHVGAILPAGGVEFYDVPPEFRRAGGYRYTIVNGHPVLVEPRSRRIVEVIE